MHNLIYNAQMRELKYNLLGPTTNLRSKSKLIIVHLSNFTHSLPNETKLRCHDPTQ